jgi:hypothetical protein
MICCSLNFDFFIAELLYEEKLYFYLVRLSAEASNIGIDFYTR